LGANPVLVGLRGAIHRGPCGNSLGQSIAVRRGNFERTWSGSVHGWNSSILGRAFFRKEFARDAFLASFRYVLPPEFKDEVARIIRFEFIAEKQVWKVEIDKLDDNAIKITTSFDKTIKNASKLVRKTRGLYTVPELSFNNGPVKVCECTIECGNEQITSFTLSNQNGHLNASTKEIDILPGRTARVYGKAIQYRRIDDIIYETFTTPAINPEIEVIVPEEFEHKVEFGTAGGITKSAYGNRYTLSDVYFPGQYMFVRWWPKKMREVG
jgi:hypothetical protein